MEAGTRSIGTRSGVWEKKFLISGRAISDTNVVRAREQDLEREGAGGAIAGVEERLLNAVEESGPVGGGEGEGGRHPEADFQNGCFRAPLFWSSRRRGSRRRGTPELVN
jgi:hypothetical protein